MRAEDFEAEQVSKVLFVCSMNQWRSLTAERLYQNLPFLEVRSVGTSAKARRRLSLSDVRWADLILVMEQKHRDRILADFRQDARFCEIIVLEVEDRFDYMHPELVAELREVIDPILGIDSDET